MITFRVFVTAAFLALFSILPAGAQAVRWEQAETEHFLFIYEPRDRAWPWMSS